MSRWNTRAPVKFTCPDVDKALSSAKELDPNSILSGLADIVSDLKDRADAFDQLNDLLEDLRMSNAKLREWGETEEADVDRLQKMLDDRESDHADEVSDLRDGIDDLKTTLASERDDHAEEVRSLTSRMEALEAELDAVRDSYRCDVASLEATIEELRSAT